MELYNRSERLGSVGLLVSSLINCEFTSLPDGHRSQAIPGLPGYRRKLGIGPVILWKRIHKPRIYARSPAHGYTCARTFK